jgi:hypothetical protein
VAAEVDAVLHQLDLLVRDLRSLPERTLLLVTADHGQTDVDPATTVYVNDKMPGLKRWLRRDGRGRPLLFGGSPRDLFLYIADEHLGEAQADLERALDGRALVIRSEDLIALGLFGPGPVSGRLLDRLGNLALLPLENESVYWRAPGRFEQIHYGHHGGLTPDEMHIPLIAYPL